MLPRQPINTHHYGQGQFLFSNDKKSLDGKPKVQGFKSTVLLALSYSNNCKFSPKVQREKKNYCQQDKHKQKSSIQATKINAALPEESN